MDEGLSVVELQRNTSSNVVNGADHLCLVYQAFGKAFNLCVALFRENAW